MVTPSDPSLPASLTKSDPAVSPPPPDSSISPADSLEYWNGAPATVDGMLGGFATLDARDIRGSAAFLAKLQRESPAFAQAMRKPGSRGADCGAG